MLPSAVVAQILQHVPQEQRLCSCALVCRTWAAGAALATTHISAGYRYRPVLNYAPALESWVHKHAKQLFSLEARIDEVSMCDLACEKKNQPNSHLQLPGADLVQLTRLSLQGVHATPYQHLC